MPIQAFGVFAAIVVSLVYILTITFQPINYYIYDKTGISKLCKKKIKQLNDSKIENFDDKASEE